METKSLKSSLHKVVRVLNMLRLLSRKERALLMELWVKVMSKKIRLKENYRASHQMLPQLLAHQGSDTDKII